MGSDPVVNATAIIAARMGSSRLPGKTLMPLAGKPMLEQMVDRVRQSDRVKKIVVATTVETEDDPIVDWAGDYGVAVHRGSAEDVLERVYAAAREQGAQTIVKLLGDNPLVHAELIDDVVALYWSGGVDYAVNVSNEQPHAAKALKRFPIGIRVEVLSFEALKRCAERAREPAHREHSTSWIVEHPDQFKLAYFEAGGKWEVLNRPELTFAVNYRKNFELVERIFERCLPLDDNFSLHDVLRAYEAEPDLQHLMGVPS